MYNTDLPRRADLPTSGQLKRSTWIASITAAAILAFVVLPSEYAVDPTGIGRMLGLTQMGEIKVQLSEEAAQDAASTAAAPAAADTKLVERLERIEAMLRNLTAEQPASPPATVPTATAAVEPEVPAVASAQDTEDPAVAEWQDEITITLAPGEGAEYKLVMEQGAQAEFFWTANGAVVNYDTHGDGGGNSVSYEKGEQQGVLEAAFTGNHGWFWRNRGTEPLTMTLRTRGNYSELKRIS